MACDDEVEQVNLLFFTIEVERDAVNGTPAKRRPASARTRRGGRLRRIGLAIAAVLCAVGAGCGGWLLAGGEPWTVELPDWVPLVTPVHAATDDQARLE